VVARAFNKPPPDRPGDLLHGIAAHNRRRSTPRPEQRWTLRVEEWWGVVEAAGEWQDQGHREADAGR
jgi:hypothetical protein